MDKLKKPKFTYLYAVFFIIIIFALLLAGIVIYQFCELKEANKELAAANEELIEKYDEAIKIIETANGERVVVQSGEPNRNNEVITELEAMKLFNEQFYSFKSDWQALITMFTILVSIFTILIPVFNYVFVVKDQLCSYQKEFNKIKDDFEDNKEGAVKAAAQALDEKYNEVEDKLKEHEKKLEVLIIEATRMTQKDIKNETEDNDLSKVDSLALRIRAAKEFYKSNYKTVIELLTEAIKLNPNKADYYNNRGVTYHAMKRYEKALEDKTKAIELEPENAGYYNSRGATYHAMKRYEKALEDKTKAIELEPENARYYDNRGVTYHAMKRYEKALEDSTKAIELEPENARYYDSRGVTYHAMKRYEEALEDSTKAIELEPENAEYLAFNAYSLFKRNQYIDSVLAINKSISLDPNLGYAYRVRGKIELKNAKLNSMPCIQSVLDDLNQAILLDKDSSKSSYHFHTRAEYYLYVGEDEKAYADLQEALKLNDQNEYAYFYLSKYWERKGNIEEARKILN